MEERYEIAKEVIKGLECVEDPRLDSMHRSVEEFPTDHDIRYYNHAVDTITKWFNTQILELVFAHRVGDESRALYTELLIRQRLRAIKLSSSCCEALALFAE